MNNIQTFLNLAKQLGKVVVVNEQGEIVGVVLSPEEFQKTTGLGAFGLRQSKQTMDAEEINRQITAAQLEEQASETSRTAAPAAPRKERHFGSRPPQNLPSGPTRREPTKMPDLRQEVIDPSFDFDSDSGDEDLL